MRSWSNKKTYEKDAYFDVNHIKQIFKHPIIVIATLVQRGKIWSGKISIFYDLYHLHIFTRRNDMQIIYSAQGGSLDLVAPAPKYHK